MILGSQRTLVAGDQIASSASVIAQLAIVARLSGPSDLGQFAVAMGVYTVLAGTIRAGAGEVLLHRWSNRQEDADAAMTLALAAGFVAGPFVILAAVLPSVDNSLCVSVALATPALVWRDNLRFVPYAKGRSGNAVTWSIANTVLDVALLATVLALGGPLAVAVLVLGAGATLMAAVQSRRESLRWRFKIGWRWLRANRSDSQFFALEALIGGGSAYAAVPAVGGVLNAPAAGTLRLGQSFMGPIGIALSSLRYADVSKLQTLLWQPTLRPLRRYLFGSASVLILLSTLIGLLLLAIPEEAVRVVAGDVAPQLRSVILWLAVQKGFSAASVPFSVLLKAVGAAPATVVLRVATIAFTVIGAVAGAESSGLLGAVIGMLLASIVIVGMHYGTCELMVRRARRDHP